MGPIITPDSGVNYPTVTIGGRTFTLKVSFLAEYTLSRAGTDVFQCLRALLTPRRVAAMTDLLASMSSHNFVEAGEIPWTAEKWAERISAEGLTNPKAWAEICKAVTDAFPKATPRADARPQPPAETVAAN